MKLDRTMALLLVGTVAAGASSACTVTDVSDPDAEGGASNTGGNEATGGGAGEASTAGAGGNVSSAGTTNQGGAAGGQTAGAGGQAAGAGGQAAGAGGQTAGAGGQVAGAGGDVSSAGTTSQGGAAGGPGCDDSVGADVTCTTTCGSFAFPGDACESVKTTLKPAVAEAVGSCIVALSSVECNDATYTYQCLYDALDAACPDPAAAAECESIRTVCTTVTQEECVQYANGTTSAGLAQYSSCMTEGEWCLPQSCAEGLSW